MQDPLREMAGLYEWLGEEFTQLTRETMLRWLQVNPQGLYGPHAYSLGKYQLSKRELQPFFATYCQAFDVALED